MKIAWVDRPHKIHLKDHDPADTHGIDSETAEKRLAKVHAQLADLQELMWSARQHSLLVVLQGIDASGKDGTVRSVFSGVNPAGCRVTSFKVPTEIESAHDFLWRIHAACPALGEIAVFNRSHYESVIIERVKNLVPDEVWRARYDRIREFEKLLTDSNTLVVKFFLHVSKDEQKRRLDEREADLDKRWKVGPHDWDDRAHWKGFQGAFQDMVSKTGAAAAPWVIVPADRKWFRNLVVAEALVRILDPHRKEWQRALRERGKATHRAPAK